MTPSKSNINPVGIMLFFMMLYEINFFCAAEL